MDLHMMQPILYTFSFRRLYEEKDKKNMRSAPDGTADIRHGTICRIPVKTKVFGKYILPDSGISHASGQFSGCYGIWFQPFLEWI